MTRRQDRAERLGVPLPPVPDKKAIGELLKSGAAVPGAHIETRNHLQIR